MSPERRRRVVAEVRRKLGPDKVSERRACRVLGQPRTTQRYQRRRPADERKLLTEMRRIAHRKTRYGSPRVHQTLKAAGWHVNHKRVERIWREESMQVPKNSTVVDDYLVEAVRIVASVDVLSIRITSGRMTSLPIESKTDERFDYW